MNGVPVVEDLETILMTGSTEDLEVSTADVSAGVSKTVAIGVAEVVLADSSVADGKLLI
jgi:hypothetical protein